MRCDAIIELEVIMGKPPARVTDMVAHPLPPVLTEPGSKTVLINNLPACRMGDTVLEAIGPPNKITMGMMTVLIGD